MSVVNVDSHGFTGIGAIGMSQGQTSASFVDMWSSAFRISSLGGSSVIHVSGAIGATGPKPGGINRAELRVAVGSEYGPVFPVTANTSDARTFALSHVTTSLPSGGATGTVQWRRAGGTMANFLLMANVDVISTSP